MKFNCLLIPAISNIILVLNFIAG